METKSIKVRIKEYFFLNPTKPLRVREIEREVNVPLPSAIRYTKELIEEEFIKLTTMGNLKFYSAKRSSLKFGLGKKFFNINSLHESGLIHHLISEYNNPVIVLFGSYSNGEDIEKSDVDLYIEYPKKIEGLEKFEKILQRKIHTFNYRNIKDIKNKELTNNILNGVVLNGFLEVF